MLYRFRVSPLSEDPSKFALQLPFAVLFDNLITVLWAIYSKNSKNQIGINQIQWALEFLKCMKEGYSYPASIGKIVHEIEEQLIKMYAKVGGKLHEIKIKQEMGEKQLETNSQNLEEERVMLCLSFNENDIMNKLDSIKLTIDSVTGEAKFLKELNALGRRKNKGAEDCKVDNKSSKTRLIGELQKILNKITEEGPKTEVEKLLKGLKVQNSNTAGTKQSSNN